MAVVAVWPPASGNKGTISRDTCNGAPFWNMKDTLNKFPQNSEKNQDSSIITLNPTWCPSESWVLHNHPGCTLKKLAPYTVLLAPLIVDAFEFNTRLTQENSGPSWGTWHIVWLPCMHIKPFSVKILPSPWLSWVWKHMYLLLAWSEKSYSLCNHIGSSSDVFFSRLLLLTSKHCPKFLTTSHPLSTILLKSPQLSPIKIRANWRTKLEVPGNSISESVNRYPNGKGNKISVIENSIKINFSLNDEPYTTSLDK